jgi:hypothetical protein
MEHESFLQETIHMIVKRLFTPFNRPATVVSLAMLLILLMSN